MDKVLNSHRRNALELIKDALKEIKNDTDEDVQMARDKLYSAKHFMNRTRIDYRGRHRIEYE